MALPPELLETIADYLWLPHQRDLVDLHDKFVAHQIEDVDQEEFDQIQSPLHKSDMMKSLAFRLVSKRVHEATKQAFARIFFRSTALSLDGARSLDRLNAIASHPELSKAVHKISLRPQRLSTFDHVLQISYYYGCYVRKWVKLPGVPLEFLDGFAALDFHGHDLGGRVDTFCLAVGRQAVIETETIVDRLAQALRRLPNVDSIEVDCMDPYYRDDEALLPEVSFKSMAPDGSFGIADIGHDGPHYSETELCNAAFQAAGRKPPPARSFAVWLQTGDFLDTRCRDMAQLCESRPKESLVRALLQAERLYIRSSASVYEREANISNAIFALKTLVSSDVLQSLTLHIGENYEAWWDSTVEHELFAVLAQRPPWQSLKELRLLGFLLIPVREIVASVAKHAASLERVELRRRPEHRAPQEAAMTDASKAVKWAALRSALVQCRRLRHLRVVVDVAGVDFVCENRHEVVERLQEEA